jgi:hypothetical protein
MIPFRAYQCYQVRNFTDNKAKNQNCPTPKGDLEFVRIRKIPFRLFRAFEGSPPIDEPAPAHLSFCISAKFVHRLPHKRSEFSVSTKKGTT